jgi:tRNA A22 N-methylase
MVSTKESDLGVWIVGATKNGSTREDVTDVLGADHNRCPSSLVDQDAILLTEAYEFATSVLGNCWRVAENRRSKFISFSQQDSILIH